MAADPTYDLVQSENDCKNQYPQKQSSYISSSLSRSWFFFQSWRTVIFQIRLVLSANWESDLPEVTRGNRIYDLSLKMLYKWSVLMPLLNIPWNESMLALGLQKSDQKEMYCWHIQDGVAQFSLFKLTKAKILEASLLVRNYFRLWSSFPTEIS